MGSAEAPQMQRSADVVVAGGGIMGSAAAYWLSRLDPALRICVVEPRPTYLNASTTRSVGGIRTQFSSKANVSMSLRSCDFIRRSEETLGVNCSFNEFGYLFLAGSDGVEDMRRIHRMQRSAGASVSLLSSTELHDRFPWLNMDEIVLGSYGEENEGYFDPYTLCKGFRNKALESDKVTYLDGSAVSQVSCGDSGHVRNVKTDTGDTVECRYLVNAAGPNARFITDLALHGAGETDSRMRLPVFPRLRHVFVVASQAKERPPHNGPLLVNPDGVYFRPEGGMYLCGASPLTEAEDPNRKWDEDLSDDSLIDHSVFEERVWPSLASTVPSFEGLKVQSAWSGHYEYNTFDQNAILSPHPCIPNLIHMNGFSGHGVQHAPAAGIAIAELILHGTSTLAIEEYAFERLLGEKQERERKVV